MGVFDTLRVLDLSTGTVGPMTTMFLADHGADVIRIEAPAGDRFASQPGYRVWHRGKRSAVIDLKSADGAAAFAALAARADIVIHAVSPGVAESLGVDHATLSRSNARLISLAITGYGNHPDHRDRPGYDALVAARTGLLYDQKGRRGTAMHYISGLPGPVPDFEPPDGRRRGADRDGPVFPRTPWPSIGATYIATLGLVAALRSREVTGRGQLVETPLLQGALAATALTWQRVENPEAPLYWMWPIDSRSVEGLYECADGRWVHHWTIRPNWVLQTAAHDEITHIDLTGVYREDPDRISMEPDGMMYGTALHEELSAAFKKYPAGAWVEAGERAGMGVALVRSPAEALADESFLADGCVVEVDDPEVGRIRHCGPLLEFSATPGRCTAPSPIRGADTHVVLAEAALTAGAARVADSAAVDGRSLAHPLSGVRVLDLGLGVAGPFCGRMLADLGADVIKVNAMYDGYWNGTHMGLGTNRGKRSVALNLKHPGGREVLERLVATADVVTTNWRPGAAARLGLDYETLAQKYPGIIVCNSRGFERGPRSDLPGTDQTAAALTGTEWEDGGCDAGNPPMWSRSNMGDTGNALLSAIAITAALYHRDRTGEGQQVGTSIVNAGLLHTSYAWIPDEGPPPDWGHVDAGQHGLAWNYRMYRCSDDRWVFIVALSAAEQAAFTAATGADHPDPDELEQRFAQRPAAEWFHLLDAADVPAEIVDEEFCRRLFDDPVARAEHLVSETWVKAVGRFEDPGLLVSLSDTPGVIRRGPAMCGEHSRELMLELGYSDEEIDQLAAQRAVLDAPVTR